MQQKPVRVPWVDYLRGFITLLVVAHHSSLAYTTFAHFNKAAYNSSTHPVVDTSRWLGLDIFEDFNDIFFMSLMFLISGIFIMQSIQNKGIKLFIRDRFYRLFIPFVVGVTLLMLLAYYPAWLLAYGKNDVKAYIIDFFTVESWPSGPPWFIWVLFAFNLIFAVLYPVVKKLVSKSAACLVLLKHRPVTIAIGWFLLTWVLYVPLLILAGPSMWTGAGPFHFQVSRILLYFGYFIVGIIIGSPGLQNGILADGTKFTKSRPAWVAGCIVAYNLLKLSEAPIDQAIQQHTISLVQAGIIYRSIWVLSCTLSSIAFLTLFKKLFQRASAWWQSLSANAYGIYLVHYIFVLWCQYLLLGVGLPAVVKFLIVFIVSVGASWGVTYLVRRNKLVRKYL
jgi:peptidoglycan/LPS O-acetylase OafA/YrhL